MRLQKSFLVALGLVAAALGIFSALAQQGAGVQAVNMDTREFPRVTMTLTFSGLPTGTTVRGRDLTLKEGGIVNGLPRVLLPPLLKTEAVDFFVVVDRTGRVALDSEAVRASLRALARETEARGLQSHFVASSFDATDAALEGPAPQILESAGAFVEWVDALTFESAPEGGPLGAPASGVHLLPRLHALSAVGGRVGARKVLLMLSATRPWNAEAGDETSYTVAETVNALAEANFIVFGAGIPFGALWGQRVAQSEDASLLKALPGGYLGGLSTDLSRIARLVEGGTAGHLLEYTTLSGSAKTPFSVQTELFGSPSGTLNVVPPTLEPEVWHEPPVLRTGKSALIRLRVTGTGLLDAAELWHLPSVGPVQKKHLERRPWLDTNDERVFETEFLAEELPAERLLYRAEVRGTTQIVSTGILAQEVLRHDEGLHLVSSPNDTNADGEADSVTWRVEGPTLQFAPNNPPELFAGETRLGPMTERRFTLAVEPCRLYHKVQARVFLPVGEANGPVSIEPLLGVGGWSLFSPPGERYLGPQKNSMTEGEAAMALMQCVPSAVLDTLEELEAADEMFEGARPLNTERWLQLLHRIMGIGFEEVMNTFGYTPVYALLNLAGSEAHEAVSAEEVHRTLTEIAQTADFASRVRQALDQFAALVRGSSSI